MLVSKSAVTSGADRRAAGWCAGAQARGGGSCWRDGSLLQRSSLGRQSGSRRGWNCSRQAAGGCQPKSPPGQPSSPARMPSGPTRCWAGAPGCGPSGGRSPGPAAQGGGWAGGAFGRDRAQKGQAEAQEWVPGHMGCSMPLLSAEQRDGECREEGGRQRRWRPASRLAAPRLTFVPSTL